MKNNIVIGGGEGGGVRYVNTLAERDAITVPYNKMVFVRENDSLYYYNTPLTSWPTVNSDVGSFKINNL
jgi:hypothetical protein